MTRRNLLTALMTTTFVLTGTSFAQTTTAGPKTPNKQVIAEDNAKEILLLMDANKDGKISKQEWMNFMSSEFDRLDTDHNGFIDQKDLLQTRISVTHVPTEVQGK